MVAEVFREGPCVTGALHLFPVFPMLHMSQALRGAEVEGGSGCWGMPGLRFECVICLFIFHGSR